MSTAVLKESTEASFRPTFFPNCNLWLDGSDSSTQSLSGTNVTEWRDKSGLGNHGATNGGTTTVSTLNSVRALSFNGTSDFTGTISNTGTTMTSFMVATLTGSAASNGRLLSCGLTTETDTASSASVSVLNRLTTTSSVYGTRSGVNTAIFGIVNPFLVAVQYTGSQNPVYYNGTLQGNPAASTGSFGYTRYRVGNTAGNGANGRWGGLVGEIIIYNSSLTTQQRQIVEGYLAWKWGLQANLPSNHPYRTIAPSLVPPIPSATITYPLLPARNSKPAPYFDPRTITSCQLWLDGADPSATGIQPSQNSSVSNWIDKSRGRNNAVSSGASIPTFTSGGGIVFNGSGSYNTNFTSSPDTQSFFVIYRWNSITTAQTFIGGTQLKQIIFYVDPPNSRWPYLGGIGTWGRWNTSALTSNVTYIAAYTFSASPGTAVLYLNGSTLSLPGSISGPQSTAATPTTSLLGPQFNGTMYEIIGFNTILSTTDRQNIEGYLAWKWGAQANLPTNHPFRAGPPTPLSQLRLPFGIKSAKWAPTQITGCLLWLDANDPNGNGSLVSNGTVLTRWVDKSGSNNTLTANGSPVYTNYNSRNAIFINSNHLSNASSMAVANTTIFFVLSISTPINDKSYFQMGANPNSGGGDTTTFFSDVNVTRPGGNGTGRLYYGDGGGNQMSISFPTATSADVVPYFIQTARITSAPIVQNYVNSALSNSKTGTVARVNQTGVIVGSSNGGWQWTGYFSEVIIFNTALSVANQQKVEGYLAWKWNLASSLPSSHPFKLFPPSP